MNEDVDPTSDLTREKSNIRALGSTRLANALTAAAWSVSLSAVALMETTRTVEHIRRQQTHL